MISVESYIQLFKNIHSNPRAREYPWFLNYTQRQQNAENIKLIEVYSSNVYPDHIRIKDKDFILWDYLFWDIYEQYLLMCFCLEKRIDVEYVDKYMRGLGFLFLSLRYESNPMASLFFSEKYRIAMNECACASILHLLPLDYKAEYVSGNIRGSAMETILKGTMFPMVTAGAKVFVYLHECAHVGNDRASDKMRDGARDGVRNSIILMKENNLLKLGYKENQSYDVAELLDAAVSDIMERLNNNDFVDEIISDQCAYQGVYNWVKSSAPEKYADSYWDYTHIMVDHLFKYVGFLSALESFWDVFFITILKPMSMGEKEYNIDSYKELSNVNTYSLARQLIAHDLIKFSLSLSQEENINYYESSIGTITSSDEFQECFTRASIEICNPSLIEELIKRPLLLESHIQSLFEIIEQRNKLIGWL